MTSQNKPNDREFEIHIPDDFCNTPPRAFLNIPESQIINTIENPRIKDRLTYFDFTIDLLLKKFDSVYLFVIAIVEGIQERRKVAEAFYIDNEIIDTGLSIPPIMWDLVLGEDKLKHPTGIPETLISPDELSFGSRVNEGQLSRLFMLLRKFLKKHGLKLMYQGEEKEYIAKELVKSKKATFPDPILQTMSASTSLNSIVLNPSNHEKWEIKFFAKHTVTGNSVDMYVILYFCIDFSLYQDWFKSIK